MSASCRQVRPLLGTLVSIEADATPDVAQPAIEQAFARIAHIQTSMSFHAADSDLRRLAAAPAGTVLHVSPDTHAVLTLALALEQASEGAFNVCCAGELVRRKLLPHPDDALPEAASLTLSAAIELLPDARVCVRQTAWIDLGGIAKGYAVDAAVDALQRAGVTGGQVNAGGDLRVLGARTQSISVRDPRRPTQLRPLAEIADLACATSAWALTGRHTWEHLVAQSGQTQVTQRPMSVTVMAPSCAVADALTKVVCLDPQHAQPLLAHYHASAWLWYASGHSLYL